MRVKEGQTVRVVKGMAIIEDGRIFDTGKISRINGEYIIIRLTYDGKYCNRHVGYVEVERYACEIEEILEDA